MKIDTEKLLLFIRERNPRCLLLKSYEVKKYDTDGHSEKDISSKGSILTNCVFEDAGLNKDNSSLYARECIKVKVRLDEFNDWCRLTFLGKKD